MGSVIVIVIILFFLVGHAVLIESYRGWFLKVKPFKADLSITPSIFFTVVIPARNEEDRIGNCLQSVLNQNYPSNLFEVIVADDYSTDNTGSIVTAMGAEYANLHLLQIEKLLGEKKLNSYKKKALELAIQEAKGDWIVTTDADCIVTKHWLFNLSSFIQENDSVFVAAPVKFINTGSFVSIFQCLDFMSLQGITAASVNAGFHTMCNGANLAYNKKVFYEVGGFKGIDNIASGDDMLLMHKIYSRYKTRVHYLFSQQSIVETTPMETWKAFFNQRIRWASKADKFEDKRIMYVLIFVYFFNLSFLLLPIAAIWINNIAAYWLLMLAAKTIIDCRFMIPVAKFFKEEKLLWWFPVMQPFHIAYTIIAGWLGKFGKYSWKGREVR
jgi:cellulose synthase/poly-beta-1,6-N-acetylglucosamine synthase-like glycosyltransferase